jgi:hypothetical protein
MRLSGIGPSVRIGSTATGQAPANDAGAPGRALIALAPPIASEPASRLRDAPFLAQLIAGKQPPHRGVRRVAPGEGAAAYRAAAKLTGNQ